MHSYWLDYQLSLFGIAMEAGHCWVIAFQVAMLLCSAGQKCSVNDNWWHKQMFVVWKCVWFAFISHKLCNMSMFNNVVHPFLLLSEKVPPRLELGSLDSESRVLTITPWNPETSKMSYAWRHMCQFSIIFDNSFALTHLNFIMKGSFRALVI